MSGGWGKVVVGLWLLASALIAGGGAASASEPSFAAFVESLWPEASRPPYSVSRPTFDRAFRGVTPDLTLPDLAIPGRTPPRTSGQAEFVRSPEAYLDRRQLAGLAATGRQLADTHAASLATIESRLGVPAPVVLAIWGRETAYGTYKLPHDAIRVLATQAWVGRRKDLFRTELLFALKLIEGGIVAREAMRSSWAGAMGLTQFMPSEFFKSLEDLDGGRADILGSVPDALASAAKQLAQKGWVRGIPWGIEVRLAGKADCALEGPGQARPIKDWSGLGLVRADGRPLPEALAGVEAYLMSPAGAYGPSFLVTENFKVIRRYNMSDLYATFVGTLADRIGGADGFVTGWKDNPQQLTEPDVAEIQRRLKARGFDVDKIDGKIGSNMRMNIGLYQRSAGLAVECWPTTRLVRQLTAAAP